MNTDEIKRYARVVITVAGGTGAGAVSVVWPGTQEVQLIFDLPPPQCGAFSYGTFIH